MWPFKKKKVVFVPYVPQGRIGFKRIEANNTWYFNIIVEEIGNVDNKSKIKVIELNIDRDCDKTKDQCLKRWGGGNWFNTTYFRWETEEQKCLRQGIPYIVPEVVAEPEEIEYKLTQHNFITNN